MKLAALIISVATFGTDSRRLEAGTDARIRRFKSSGRSYSCSHVGERQAGLESLSFGRKEIHVVFPNLYHLTISFMNKWVFQLQAS